MVTNNCLNNTATVFDVDNIKIDDTNLISCTLADTGIRLQPNGIASVGITSTDGTADLLITGTGNSSEVARCVMTVAGTSSGDPYVRYGIESANYYAHGLDTSSTSKSLKITYNTSENSPSTGTLYWDMTSAGEITQPLQPWVNAVLTGAESNITGDSTQAVLGAVSGWTERIDVGSDFSGTTFTAPVTGSYFASISVIANTLGAAHTTSNLQIVSSNYTYIGGVFSPGSSRSAGNKNSFILCHVIDMDAADTLYINFSVNNSTKTVGVDGANTTMLTIQLLS